MQLRRAPSVDVAILCGGLLALSGCGGGGGGYSGSSPSPTYPVSVTVSGLSGTGLVLANNGGTLLSVTNNGVATFGATIASASTYNVTVVTQPTNPSQTCVATNNVGTANSTMVSVAVNCTTNTYVVSGSVTGLAGTGLVLENNYGNPLPITANGNFAFTTQIASNAAYEVTVATQPSNPTQLCTVANEFGAVTNSAIASVAINCVTQTPRYAFALNYYGGSLSIYNLDAATGQLRSRGYAKLPQTPIMGVATANSGYTYILSSGLGQNPLNLPVLNAASSYLSGFRNDLVTGAKLEVPNSPIQITGTLGNLSRLSMHPNEKFLYVTDDSGANKIWVFQIDQTNGAVSALSSIPFGGTPSIVTFNRQGTFAFVASRTNKEIDVFSVDRSTGALTQIAANTVAVGNNPYGVGLNANGRLAFVVNIADSNVSVFAVDNATGKLTAAPGSPFGLGGTGAADVQTIHPSGKFVYFRNGSVSNGAGSIAGFSINQTTGALTSLAGSPYAIGVNSASNLFNGMHPNGRFLFVANQGLPNQNLGSISAFSIDPTTGVLTSLPGIAAVSPAPYSLSVDPSGKFLYVASVSGDQILSYGIDSGGLLTPLARSPSIRSGSEPISVGAYVSPNTTTAPVFKSKAAYVANDVGSISNFTVTTTGALATAGTTTASGSHPKSVATSQGSQYAFAVNSVSNSVSAYTIDAATKALTPIALVGATRPTETNPVSVTVDPTGRFVYVANNVSGSISRYTVNKSDGTLVAASASTSTIANPLQVAVDPTGRNLFVLNANTIQVFWIDSVTGAIAVPPTPVFGTGIKTLFAANGAAQFAIDPRARFLYVANPTNGGSIEIYPIDAYGGILGIGSTMGVGRANVSIAIDPAGRYAYTADSTAKTISSYSITQSTGALVATTAATIPTVSDPLQISVDYAGAVVHAVLLNEIVVSYRINQTDGSLDPATLTNGAPTGSTPGAITTTGEVE